MTPSRILPPVLLAAGLLLGTTACTSDGADDTSTTTAPATTALTTTTAAAPQVPDLSGSWVADPKVTEDDLRPEAEDLFDLDLPLDLERDLDQRTLRFDPLVFLEPEVVVQERLDRAHLLVPPLTTCLAQAQALPTADAQRVAGFLVATAVDLRELDPADLTLPDEPARASVAADPRLQELAEQAASSVCAAALEQSRTYIDLGMVAARKELADEAGTWQVTVDQITAYREAMGTYCSPTASPDPEACPDLEGYIEAVFPLHRELVRANGTVLAG